MSHRLAIRVAELQEAIDSGQHGPLEGLLIALFAGLAKRTGRHSVLLQLDFPATGPVAVTIRAKAVGRFASLVWRILPHNVALWETDRNGTEVLVTDEGE